MPYEARNICRAENVCENKKLAAACADLGLRRFGFGMLSLDT
jgi:hypothetical protein